MLQKILTLFLLTPGFMSGSPSWANSPLKVMALGDSITEGLIQDQKGSYRTTLVPELVKLSPKVAMVGSKKSGPKTLVQQSHEGHSGWRIDELYSGRLYGDFFEEGIKKWLPRYRPDIILLLIGSNDIVQDYFLDLAPGRYEALLKKILKLSPHSVIFAGSIIPTSSAKFNRDIETLNPKLEALVKKMHHVFWVDLYGEAKLDANDGDFIDGVHPTIKGFRKISDVWLSHLKKYFSSSKISFAFQWDEGPL